MIICWMKACTLSFLNRLHKSSSPDKHSNQHFICYWDCLCLNFFSMGMVLFPVSCTMSRTSFQSSSGTLSIRSRPLNLFLAHSPQKSLNVLGCNLKNDRMISVHCQGKPFSITVIQVYALTINAEEAEVERFYENLQDLQ